MIFLHGFLGTPSDWTRIVSHLDTDEACHCPLIPGHMSTSPPPLRNAFEYTVDLLHSGITQENDESNILVGYSLGGRIALEWATRYPERFSRLILISASFGIESEKERHSRLMWDTLKAELLRKKGVERFMTEEWYNLDLFKDFAKSERFSSIVNSRLSHSCRYLADAFEAYSPGRQEPFFDKIDSLPPITYIYGENDRKYANLAANLKEAHSVETHGINDIGHVGHLEAPSKVARIINTALNY